MGGRGIMGGELPADNAQLIQLFGLLRWSINNTDCVLSKFYES